VQVWDVIMGQRLVTYRGHAAEVWEVSWSPDGQHLASVGDDGVAQLWNATKGMRPVFRHFVERLFVSQEPCATFDDGFT
jgi:WD40 repeat protein